MTISRRLQGSDAAPGDTHHPDGTRAPWLRGDPGDYILTVLLLKRQVLIKLHALRVPGASHIHPNSRIAVPGEIVMYHLVTVGGTVRFSIRNVFKNGWYRRLICSGRQPEFGRQPAAIGHRDPDMLGDFDRVRVLVDDSGHVGCAF